MSFNSYRSGRPPINPPEIANPSFYAARKDATYVSFHSPLLRNSKIQEQIVREYALRQGYRNLSDILHHQDDWEKNIFTFLPELKHKTGLVITDVSGNIRDAITLDNTSDLNSYLGGILGVFAAGYERGNYFVKSVQFSDRVAYLKLQNTLKAFKGFGIAGTTINTLISAFKMQNSGFSPQSIVRFGVDGSITILGLFNPDGLPIGFSAALILGSLNSEGAFEEFYQLFDNKPLFK